MALSIQPTPVFWCEPTGRIRRHLRCYQGRGESAARQLGVPAIGEPPACQKEHGYCNAMFLLDEIEEEFEPPNAEGNVWRKSYDAKHFPWEAFPVVCEDCGMVMTNPTRQVFTDEIYEIKTGPRAGERFARREAPVGAMWEITWYRDIPDWCGRDGMALNVVTPGGEWSPDSRANNCTRPDDKAHRCWVRRGDPKTGYCHVDKDATVQETCEAGGGSIWINKDGPRDWHGFLYRGFLIDADDHSRGKVDAMLEPVIANPVAPAERVLKPYQIDTAGAVRRTERQSDRISSPEKDASPPYTPPKPAWRSNRRPPNTGFQARPKS